MQKKKKIEIPPYTYIPVGLGVGVVEGGQRSRQREQVGLDKPRVMFAGSGAQWCSVSSS